MKTTLVLLLICASSMIVYTEESSGDEKPSTGILAEIERAYENTKDALGKSLEIAYNKTRDAGETVGDELETIFNRTREAIQNGVERAYEKAKERMENGFNVEDFYNDVKNKISEQRERILGLNETNIADTGEVEQTTYLPPMEGKEVEASSIIIAPLRCESDETVVGNRCRTVVR